MRTVIRIGVAFAFGLILVTAVTACTLLGDFDVPLGSGPLAGGDASAPAGAILYETFDDERPACGFDVDEGAAVPDPEARTGKRSCRICSSANGQRIRVLRTLPPRAGRYIMSVWLRRAPGSARPTAWEIRFFADRPDAGDVTTKGSGQSEETWQLGQTTITLAEQPSSLRIRIGSEQDLGPGDCLLIDDLQVVHEP